MVREGYLQQDPEFNTLTVTERGRGVLFEGERVHLAMRPRVAISEVRDGHPYSELFEKLRLLRKRLADEQGIPPYFIFQDGTLRQMAAALPRTRDELLRISGVGQRKAADYGNAFMEAIATYVRDHDVQPAPLAPSASAQRSRDGLSNTVAETLRLYRQGHDLATIASTRSLARSTIEGHLAEALEAGEVVDIDRLVSAERRRAIEEAFAEIGLDFLSPVMQKLGDGYTYCELRLVQAALRRTGAS
jgi:ATP-dependent DNA helicase RecQ